jgi:hypothetical protein
MPIVRDIKNRDSKKVLNLKKEGSDQPVKKNIPSDVLDLSKQKPDRPRFLKEKKQPSEKHVFVVQKEQQSTNKKSYKDFIRFLVADAFEGYQNFVEGGKDAMDADFGGAVQYFETASHAFAKAQEKVWFLGNESIMHEKQSVGNSAYALLESGSHLSDAASYFSQGISGLQEIPILFIQNNIPVDSQQKLPTQKISLTEKLKSSLTLFEYAFDDVKEAQAKIYEAGPYLLPSNLRSHFDALSAELDELVLILEDVQERIPAILAMLGDRYQHRYLVLLQNNTESRPTGGFIGSYLIVDVNDGYITKVDFHDVYENDGQLHEFIEAPAEIAVLTDNWRMRDSNYSPHFPLSAAKAAWFLEKEEGPGVDSVIAINQSILEDLLTLVGPIDIEGLDASLTDSNYNTILTYIVELKLEGEESPKGVLDRIIPVLQTKIYDSTSFKNLFVVIQNGIKEKNILGWSKDEKVQNFFDDIGMSGEVLDTADDQDYFSLISINVGGNKSDLYVETDILHETLIEKTGNVLNKVTVTRSHTWNPNVLLEWQKQLEPFGYTDLPEWLQNILGRGTNKSVIKMYLPPGSELEDVIGIEREEVTVGYDEELNKTYFYYMSEVAAQNESTVKITYNLPKPLDLNIVDEYRLTVQKQPGSIKDMKFKKRIIADPRLTNYRNYPEEIVYEQGEIFEYETTLKTDLHFASLWGRE